MGLLAERVVERDARDLVAVDRREVAALVEKAPEPLDPDHAEARQDDQEQEEHHQTLVITEEVEHACGTDV